MKGLLVLGAILAGSISSANQSDWWPDSEIFHKDYLIFIDQLLAVGLPDPRGGTFRKVTVKELDLTQGHSIEVIAFGWVKPGSNKVAAVNGLVYEVEKDLGSADTWDFINSSSREYKHPNEPNFRLQTTGPLFYSMLLVSGRADQVLQKNFPPQHLTADLLEVKRFRCLASFKQGDYDKAASQCADLRPLVKLAETRNLFENRESWPVIQTLDSVDRLAREIERRKLKSDSISAPSTDESERDIRASIEGLQESRNIYRSYAYRKWDEYEAVLTHGERAIPNLIDAYESHPGLTRIFLQQFNELPKGLETVSYQAWQLILTLWPQVVYLRSFNSLPRPADLRLHWERAKGLTLTEKYIEILSDPTLTPESYESAFRNATLHFETEKVSEAEKQAANDKALGLVRRRAHQLIKQAVPDSQEETSLLVSSVRLTRLFNYYSAVPDTHLLSSVADKLLDALERGNTSYPHLKTKIIVHCIYLIHDLQRLYSENVGPKVTRLNAIISNQLYWSDESVDLLSLNFVEPGFRSHLTKLEDYISVGASGTLQSTMDQLLTLVKSRCIETQALRQTLARLISLEQVLFTGGFRTSGNATYVTLSSHQTRGFRQGFSVPGMEMTADSKIELSIGDVVALYLQELSGCPLFNPEASLEERQKQREALTNWLLNESIDWRKVMTPFRAMSGSSRVGIADPSKP